MIKFFRKIRFNLISKNKTGKYLKYAIGEIFLVMVGILLALQINNWNQKRLDRIQERAILQSLHREFKENKILSTKNMATMKGALKANKAIMALMGSSGEELKKHNLDSLFLNRYQHHSLHLQNRAFQILFKVVE